MNRRHLLAGAGSAIAPFICGCLQGDFNPGGNGRGDDSFGEESTAMTLSLDAVDDDPEPLSFEIEVIGDQLTDTTFPTLDIAVENAGDRTATWHQAQKEFVFPDRSTTPDGLAIGLEGEVTGLANDEEGCARVEFGIGRDSVEIETNLDPGDAFEQRYAIIGVDEHLDGRCPEPNTYRTEYEYGDHGTWGFEFRLE